MIPRVISVPDRPDMRGRSIQVCRAVRLATDVGPAVGGEWLENPVYRGRSVRCARPSPAGVAAGEQSAENLLRKVLRVGMRKFEPAIYPEGSSGDRRGKVRKDGDGPLALPGSGATFNRGLGVARGSFRRGGARACVSFRGYRPGSWRTPVVSSTAAGASPGLCMSRRSPV